MKKDTTLINILIFLSYLMVLLGGLVQLTQAGLSCPDWPVCYTSSAGAQDALISNAHRLLGLLILVLNFVVFLRVKDKSESRKFAIFSLVFLFIQGGLGALTAIYKLPTITSLCHFILSIIYIMTLINLKHSISSFNVLSEKLESLKKSYRPYIRHGILFTFSMVFIQSLLGVIVNKSGAGKVCGLGVENVWTCVEQGVGTFFLWPMSSPAQLNMVHRGLGGLTLLLIILFGTIVVSFSNHKLIRSSLLKVSKASMFLFVLAYGIYISANGVLNFENRDYYLLAHYAVATLILIVLWSINKNLEDIEEKVSPEGAHTFLSDLVMLTKPKLAGLVMVTVAVGILLAPGTINFFQAVFSFFLIQLVVAGAAILNCYIEVDVDSLMERTKDRPLPSGRMKPKVALIFGTLCLVVSLPLIYFYVNPATCYLSVVAAVLYLWAYTPLKRISPTAVYVGAIPGAIPPVLGWTIVMGEMDPMAWILFWILFVWQLPHFLAISIYHANDYGAASIKVYPNQSGYSLTKLGIAGFTILLAVVAYLPYSYGYASKGFSVFSLVLNGAFVVLSFLGYKYGDDKQRVKKWARLYFLASVFYLPLLLGGIIFFR